MLMRVFREFGVEYVILRLSVSHWTTLAVFAAPISINWILNYLETGGADTSSIRPWFWLFWLFVGPILRNVRRNQWYRFVVLRTFVHTGGLLTQLVFEHSLRIRLRTESSRSHVSSLTDSYLYYSMRIMKQDTQAK